MSLALAGHVTETAGAYPDCAGWDDASGAFVDEDAAWGFLKHITHAVSHAARSVGHAVSHAGRGIAKAATYAANRAAPIAKLTRYLPSNLAATAALEAARLAAKRAGLGSTFDLVHGQIAHLASNPTALRMAISSARQIANGGRLDRVLVGQAREVLGDLRARARIASMAAGFVPGPGTGVAAALAAADALADGKSITDATIAAARASIPGGPVAQLAFDTAVQAAKGQGINAAALNAVRAQVPDGPARAAFDAGLAIARGQSIQEAALNAGRQLLPPSPASAAALDFATRVARGERLDRAALSTAGKAAVDQIKRAALAHVGPQLAQLNAARSAALGAYGAGKRVFSMIGNAGDPLGSDDPLKEVDPLDASGPINFAALRRVSRTAHLPHSVARGVHAIMNNPRLRGVSPHILAAKLAISPEEARTAIASVASSIARKSPMFSMPSPNQVTAIGTASLDRLMGQIGRPARPRFSPKSLRALGHMFGNARGIGSSAYNAGAQDATDDVAQSQANGWEQSAMRHGRAYNTNTPPDIVQDYRAGYESTYPVALAKQMAGGGGAQPAKKGGGGGIAFDAGVQQAQRDLVAFEGSIPAQVPNGWGPADADGKAGPRTATATAFFQNIWNKRPTSLVKLPTDGKLDALTRAALAYEVRGVPSVLIGGMPQIPPATTPPVVGVPPAPPVFTPPELPPGPGTAPPVFTPPALPPGPGGGGGKELMPDLPGVGGKFVWDGSKYVFVADPKADKNLITKDDTPPKSSSGSGAGLALALGAALLLGG
jgi:hypothetical protein